MTRVSLMARFDRVLREADALRALLREVQFEGRCVTAGSPPVLMEACCPLCHGLATDGHRDHCRLKAALLGGS